MHTLTISNNSMPFWVVADSLLKVGLSGDIIPGLSVVGGKVEERAEVRIFDCTPADVRRFWDHIAPRLGLTCAWHATEGYEGCILEGPAFSPATEGLLASATDDEISAAVEILAQQLSRVGLREDHYRRSGPHGDPLFPN